jgi:hypothetical protein
MTTTLAFKTNALFSPKIVAKIDEKGAKNVKIDENCAKNVKIDENCAKNVKIDEN